MRLQRLRALLTIARVWYHTIQVQRLHRPSSKGRVCIDSEDGQVAADIRLFRKLGVTICSIADSMYQVPGTDIIYLYQSSCQRLGSHGTTAALQAFP